MQATFSRNVVSVSRGATFFADDASMPKKSVPSHRGRPPGVYLTPEEIETVAALLLDAVTHMKDAAKFMRENELPQIMIPAAKIIDEHVPITANFARRLYSEVGTASVLYRLGRQTKMERNSVRGAKYRGKKSAGN